LVHPGDHAVRLIGWAAAQPSASPKAQATDLLRSALVVRVLLSGATDQGGVPSQVPADLAQLVMQASQDVEFCRRHSAAGLDALLRAAAKAAFGPPAFVPLII
jgi:hypothetical protein